MSARRSAMAGRRSAVAAALVALLGAGTLTACGDAAEDGEQPSTAPTPAAEDGKGAGEASSTKSEEAPDEEPRSKAFAGSEEWDVFPTGDAEFEISGARTGGHEGFDRFVVELKNVAGNGKPGWWVEVTENPLGAGSGLPESYEGQTAVVVTVRGIKFPGGEDGAGAAPEVERAASEKLIRSVEDQSWWEGDQRYLIGVGVKDPQVKVNYLQDPPRVVVDIAG